MSDKHSPAFPAIDGSTAFYERGLTKREYFAGLALQGLLASLGQHDVTHYDELASDAVMAADALLTELKKTQP